MYIFVCLCVVCGYVFVNELSGVVGFPGIAGGWKPLTWVLTI